MPEQVIKVACEGSATYAIDDLEPLQGDMKTLDAAAAGRLRESIVRYGFSFPFFVWRTRTKLKLIDGHQRLKVLLALREEEGWEIPELPCVEVYARTRDEAKRKLLAAASQYGRLNVDGLEGFLSGMRIGDLTFVDLPGLKLDDLEPPPREIEPGEGEREIDDVETENECPRCHFRW